MTRLRSRTISEKPTSLSREASRKTVGEVVTCSESFLPDFWGWAEDYSLRRWAIQVEAILLRNDFK
jgi:hypothetical protein